jgi:ribonuclease HII
MLLAGAGTNALIGGVDEAGRGSIIGPMIVAGVSLGRSGVRQLRELGIRDSKALTPLGREKFYRCIVDLAHSLCVVKIDCREIDRYVFFNGLNELEARGMGEVINSIRANRIYVDACDVNLDRYQTSLRKHIHLPQPRVYCLHHADCINEVVSAASIVAKIVRDREVQEIRKKYHNIGSGYPSDKKTMFFIKKWVRRYKSPPLFARRSWKPLRIMLEEQCS